MTDTSPEQTSATPRPEIQSSYDVVIVGGGPTGTTAGILLKKEGYDVLVIEKDQHPRFCVGESLLPLSNAVWKRLGLEGAFDSEGYVQKHGAYFDFSEGGAPEYFPFADSSNQSSTHAWHVPRAEFDKLLWDNCIKNGVTCVDQTEVKRFRFDGDRATGVDLQLPDGSDMVVNARLVMDCAGRVALMGQQLKMRDPDTGLNKVCLFTHFDGAFRSSGDDEGTIGIIATEWGWMWMIPFAGDSMSVGAVISNTVFAKRIKGSDPTTLWAELLAETPAVAARLAPATQTREVECLANYSFKCTNIAGDGWVLVGDSAAFLDPVFSSGVHLCVSAAAVAADCATVALRGDRLPTKADFASYENVIDNALKVFSRFIHDWYREEFRWAFMRPPSNALVRLVKRHITAILAGDAFSYRKARPWLWLLETLARLNAWRIKREGLVPPPGRAPLSAPVQPRE